MKILKIAKLINLISDILVHEKEMGYSILLNVFLDAKQFALS
jgi:hypothetical protein